MKATLIILFMAGCNFCFGQKWTPIVDNRIEYLSLVDHGDTTVFFKKDSAAIGVPIAMSVDFRQLFLQDQHSFDIINDSCIHFPTFMLGDSVEVMFKKYGIKHIVYFIRREIIKAKEEETWSLTNLYGQGQPCWPGIVIKRTRNKSLSIIFLSFIRGICEI